MRKILASLLIMSFNAYAAAPTAINSETAATKIYAQDVKLPNNQATKLAGLDTRVETGNTNLLANPSFEAATASTSWTLTNATAAESLVDFTDGKKGLTVTPTVAGGGIKQTSTLYASKIIGGQGIASISVKTTGTDVYVCPLMNGARPSDTTKYCVNVKPTSTSVVFPKAIVPFILDGTSNGIEIFSTGTSVFTVENAFVGESAPLQGVSGAKLVGAVKITNCATPWTLTSTSYASFTAQTGCVYTTYGQAVADTSFGPTQLPSIKFATLPPGDYSIQYEGGTEMGTSNVVTQFRFTDGTNTSREETTLYSNTAVLFGGTLNHSISYSTTQTNVTLQIQGKSPSSTVSVDGTASRPGVIKVWYFPPESKIYSQASQDTGWQSFTPTSSNNSLSFTSPSMFWKRQGGDLLIMGSATVNAGASGASEARMDFPSAVSGTTLSTVLANTTVGISTVGANTASNYYAMIKPSVSYISFSAQNSGSHAQTLLSGTAYYSAGIHSFQMRIPIQGWQDYGVIVGSFAETTKVPGVNKPTEYFASIASSGVPTEYFGQDWINGNCAITGTSNFDCTLNSGYTTATPFCNVQQWTNNSTGDAVLNDDGAMSASHVTFKTFNQAGAATTRNVILHCWMVAP